MRRYSKDHVASAVVVGAIVCAVAALFIATAASNPKPVKKVVAVQHLEPFGAKPLPTVGPAGTIYLSFDDGPSIVTTPQILSVLSQYSARATFFTVGTYVDRYPDIVKSEYDQGNSVQNHTYDHRSLKNAPPDLFGYEVGRNQDAIKKADGVAPTCVRAPYDDFNQEVIDRLHGANLNLIGWTVDSNDWRKPGVDQIVQNVVNNIRPGGIILMHDAGGDDRTQTVAALQQIIPALRDRGFGFGLLCR